MSSKIFLEKSVVQDKKDNYEDKSEEIIRDEIFRQWDNPCGLSQEAFTMLYYLTGHLGALLIFNRDHSSPILFGTVIFALFYGYLGGLGITIGCHRYWTHRTFKAKLPLQILLMIWQSITGHHPIHKWCLDHRLHHKYVDTNADSYNSKRGFWYSHVLWLFTPKHEDLQNKLKTFDMSDLENDPVVRLQSKYYLQLIFAFSYAIPVSMIHYVWGVSWFNSVALNFLRWVVTVHITSCINSVAHMWGDKPYDKSISPTEVPILSLFAAGEGFHNFHHTFPNDYRTSEFGGTQNLSTMFIDFFAKIGWAYDLKTVSDETVTKRKNRTGCSASENCAYASENVPEDPTVG